MTNFLSCCFIGYSPMQLPFGFDERHPGCLALKVILKKEIGRMIERGCTHFISGVDWGADMICAEIVLELKRHYPRTMLTCAIPYEEQAAKWNEEYRMRYFSIVERSDKMILLSHRYTPSCLYEHGCYMVDNSMYVIAVCDKSEKNIFLDYAMKKERDITIIDPCFLTVRRSDMLIKLK